MGTTLTGTTPQDTYDSLIKVTDNGPLSGTAKYLSDGLGNDSVLALSTGAAGIATTTIVSGTKLSVGGPTSTLGSAGTPAVYLTNSVGASGTAQQYATLGTSATPITTLFRGNGLAGTTANGLNIDNFGGFQVRVNQLGGSGDSINLLGGNVGVGTTAPAVPLDVVGNIRSSTGILFGTDTAAANALDDYEEGTWTIGITFGGASVGVTSSGNTGTYTKIGRQVTVNGILSLTSKGSSTGIVEITGLPFTIAAGGSNFCVASLWLNSVTFLNQYVGRAIPSTNVFRIEEFSNLGTLSNITDADFANNSEVLLSLTYFA